MQHHAIWQIDTNVPEMLVSCMRQEDSLSEVTLSVNGLGVAILPMSLSCINTASFHAKEE